MEEKTTKAPLSFDLAQEFFRGHNIERWNDTIRPFPFYEIDKHGHKLMIAYILAKYEEKKGNTVDWELIIKNSIFELLRRIIISDIKSPIYAKFKENKEIFRKLNAYVFNQVQDKIGNIKFKNEFKNFLEDETKHNTLTYRIIDAAHIYSSYWEYKIIENFNPFKHQNEQIRWEITKSIVEYSDLEGINKLLGNHSILNFIDICGQLRFQKRWAQTPRVPVTSVLGHVTLVAVFTYILSSELNFCKKRIYNNFFGALFHDLPETVTRDIISPVKRSSYELDNLISEIEEELAQREILPYLEDEWQEEIKYFTQNEFANKYIEKSKIKTTKDNIDNKYNKDEFSPHDGLLIRFADHYSAYLEAYNSIVLGISTDDLKESIKNIKQRYKNVKICNMDISPLFKTKK
ncbi:MAG: HD domain-containing protein [Bacteroidetes bacterium]|nr:HD domain-containing protein [Bacteroidota bacterium]